MKSLYHFLLIPLFLFCVLSCKNQEIHSGQDSLDETYLELQKIAQMPDSLLTEEERSRRYELFSLIKGKVSVKGNQFHSTAKRKDFTDKGLSKYYYDILEKSISETNQWAKKEGITNLDSLWRSSIEGTFFKKE